MAPREITGMITRRERARGRPARRVIIPGATMSLSRGTPHELGGRFADAAGLTLYCGDDAIFVMTTVP